MENTTHQFELGKSSKVLINELMELKASEVLVITADTESDFDVINSTAQAAFAAGAQPIVVHTPTPRGVGKAADDWLPSEALGALLQQADAWIEFNNKWLLYSKIYNQAFTDNEGLRHLCLVGMRKEIMTRCIGRVDHCLLERFLSKVKELTESSRRVKITSPSGTEVSFLNDPDEAVLYDAGYASTPGSHMLGGQVGWKPKIDSIEGIIVFDGSVVPPLGRTQDPIKLEIHHGEIVGMEGKIEANKYKEWLSNFDHPQMFKLAHVCYGFNPGAKLTGNILEDERVWGCTEWGIGDYKGTPAPTHSDGVCLNSSVWLDGRQLLEQGTIAPSDLRELADKLRT